MNPWHGPLAEQERVSKVLELYEHAASRGNVRARLRVGDEHYYGRSTGKPDKKLASAYYRAAKEGMSPQAAFNLAYMHQFGRGVSQVHLYHTSPLTCESRTFPWPSVITMSVHLWTRNVRFRRRLPSAYLTYTGACRPYIGG